MNDKKWHKLADIAVVAGIWSTMLALLAVCALSPLYLGAKIDNFRSTMYQEMKDFHGRLERHECDIENLKSKK